MAARLPAWHEVTRSTRCHGPGVPELGFRDGDDLAQLWEDRVYVLRCKAHYDGGPYTWYVGSAKRHKVAERLKAQFTQAETAADFCKQNQPIQLELLWPVPSEAAEAYVFYALVATRTPQAVGSGRVGGWTATQAAPDQFNRLMMERDRRMLTGSCLKCGLGTPRRRATLQTRASSSAATAMRL